MAREESGSYAFWRSLHGFDIHGVPCINGLASTIQMRYPACGLRALGVALSCFLFVACGGSSDVVVSEATSTSPPTATSLAATATPTVESSPTVTPEAAPSPTPLTPTSTPLPSATSTPTLTPTETAAPEATEPAQGYVDLDNFAAALDELVRDVDGTVAVSLMSAEGDVLWELNPDEPMEAASLYKLAIMVEVYHRQAEGELAFDEMIELTCAHFNEGEDNFLLSDIGTYVSAETLVTSMITLSSNVAAYALLELVGTESVNATMTGLGLDGIEIRWSPRQTCNVEPPAPDEFEEPLPEVESPETQEPPDEPPLDETQEPAAELEPSAEWLSLAGTSATVRGEAAFNVAQSSDLARLLVLMLNGEVVSADASQAMLDLLASQQIYGGLPALLPEGVVAHKTGYLADGIVNDAGVIYTPSGPLVAVVLTENVGEATAFDITSRIGLLVYQLGAD